MKSRLIAVGLAVAILSLQPASGQQRQFPDTVEGDLA